MDQTLMLELADRILAAWNTQDVERVAACYTEDLVYRDPNTRGLVRGRAEMRRYLTRLFATWTMTWTRREAYLFSDGEGCVVLWRALFRRAGAPVEIEIGGMDLVQMRGDRIARNEVYFDRTPLAALETASPAGTEAAE